MATLSEERYALEQARRLREQANAFFEEEAAKDRADALRQIVVAWLDDVENRLSIEAGGYGDVDALVTTVSRGLRNPHS